MTVMSMKVVHLHPTPSTLLSMTTVVRAIKSDRFGHCLACHHIYTCSCMHANGAVPPTFAVARLRTDNA